MAKSTEFHPEYSTMPATGFRAREIGEVFYFTGKRCCKWHLSPRYASSGNCVQCIADKRNKIEISERFASVSEENVRRASEAMKNGFMFYSPENPCKKGHYKRFTSSHNCVVCCNEAQNKIKSSGRWRRIKKEYGLSEKDVADFLANQDCKCSICKCDISHKFHIDHCHKTKKVRSLLCQRCNQAIGLFDESKDKLSLAIEYLRKHNETP